LVSHKASGYTTELGTAVAVIQQLSAIVRSGKVTGSIGVPEKLALMGFSFASYATHTAIAAAPGIANAVILTGIGFNATGLNGNGLLRSFVPRIANLRRPKRGDRGTVQRSRWLWLVWDADLSGYLTWSTSSPTLTSKYHGHIYLKREY
jgi:hypothetical protein